MNRLKNNLLKNKNLHFSGPPTVSDGFQLPPGRSRRAESESAVRIGQFQELDQILKFSKFKKFYFLICSWG